MKKQINQNQYKKFVRHFDQSYNVEPINKISQQPPSFQDLNKIHRQRISSNIIIPCLFSLIKKVKLNPSCLISYLQKRLTKYDSQQVNLYYPFFPDKNFAIRTSHGSKGVEQLIKYLQNLQLKQQRRQCKQITVKWSHELHCAAMKRAEGIEKNNILIKQMDIGQLVNQFVHWRAYLSQIIVYGFIDPKQILIQGFLEDTSEVNINRQEFFNQAGKIIGIGMAEHEVYKVVTVIIFAGDLVQHIQYERKIKHPEHCQCSIY